MIEFLICFLIVIFILFLIYLMVKLKIKKFTKEYFGTDSLKEAIYISEIQASETPKSVFGMENIYLPKLQKDFPELNINEIKSMTEETIINVLNAIEIQDISKIKNISGKVKTWTKSKINDLRQNKFVNYDSIKIHKTILNKYSNNGGIATITMQSAVEYQYKEDNKLYKKYQKRFTVEFIHIMDTNSLNNEQNVLTINCPNCGAPLKKSNEKYCKYCDSGIIDIVSKVWIINNIKED